MLPLPGEAGQKPENDAAACNATPTEPRPLALKPLSSYRANRLSLKKKQPKGPPAQAPPPPAEPSASAAAASSSDPGPFSNDSSSSAACGAPERAPHSAFAGNLPGTLRLSRGFRPPGLLQGSAAQPHGGSGPGSSLKDPAAFDLLDQLPDLAGDAAAPAEPAPASAAAPLPNPCAGAFLGAEAQDGHPEAEGGSAAGNAPAAAPSKRQQQWKTFKAPRPLDSFLAGAKTGEPDGGHRRIAPGSLAHAACGEQPATLPMAAQASKEPPVCQQQGQAAASAGFAAFELLAQQAHSAQGQGSEPREPKQGHAALMASTGTTPGSAGQAAGSSAPACITELAAAGAAKQQQPGRRSGAEDAACNGAMDRHHGDASKSRHETPARAPAAAAGNSWHRGTAASGVAAAHESTPAAASGASGGVRFGAQPATARRSSERQRRKLKRLYPEEGQEVEEDMQQDHWLALPLPPQGNEHAGQAAELQRAASAAAAAPERGSGEGATDAPDQAAPAGLQGEEGSGPAGDSSSEEAHAAAAQGAHDAEGSEQQPQQQQQEQARPLKRLRRAGDAAAIAGPSRASANPFASRTAGGGLQQPPRLACHATAQLPAPRHAPGRLSSQDAEGKAAPAELIDLASDSSQDEGAAPPQQQQRQPAGAKRGLVRLPPMPVRAANGRSRPPGDRSYIGSYSSAALCAAGRAAEGGAGAAAAAEQPVRGAPVINNDGEDDDFEGDGGQIRRAWEQPVASRGRQQPQEGQQQGGGDASWRQDDQGDAHDGWGHEEDAHQGWGSGSDWQEEPPGPSNRGADAGSSWRQAYRGASSALPEPAAEMQSGAANQHEAGPSSSARAAAHSGPPWWSRLDETFVPVAALRGGRDPRDGAAIHVDYHAQFSGAAAAGSAGPKGGRGSKRGGKAAAAHGEDGGSGGPQQGYWKTEYQRGGPVKVYYTVRGARKTGAAAYKAAQKEQGTGAPAPPRSAEKRKHSPKRKGRGGGFRFRGRKKR